MPITGDVNLADETYETRVTRHEMVNERERRRGVLYSAEILRRDRAASPAEKRRTERLYHAIPPATS